MFSYKGVSLEELEKMTIEDFIKLVPSRARRSLNRMSHQFKQFVKKMRHHKKAGSDKPMKTHFREMIILPEMIGMRMQVYCGKEWSDFTVKAEMVGRRLGEFAHTCKLVRHSGPGIGATRGSKAVELK